MKNETTLLEFFVLLGTNVLSILLVFLYRKRKTIKLQKEILRLEMELRDSHAELLEHMQQNVQLEERVATLEKQAAVPEKPAEPVNGQVTLKKGRAA